MVFLRVLLVMFCTSLAADQVLGRRNHEFFRFVLEQQRRNERDVTDTPIYKRSSNDIAQAECNLVVTAHTKSANAMMAETSKKPNCGEEQLMMLLNEKFVDTPERIVMQLGMDPVYDNCQQILRLLRNYNTTIVNCIPPPPDNIYMKLFSGLKFFYDEVCQENVAPFYEHHKCYMELLLDWMECQGPADWYEREDHVYVCSIFNQVTTCNYLKTSMFCDIAAARKVVNLTQSVFNLVLNEKCPVIEWTGYAARYDPAENGAYGKASLANLQQLLIFQLILLLLINFYGSYWIVANIF